MEGHNIEGVDLAPLQEDLALLDYWIRPESEIGICREYAVKCVSQANSAASRRWRLKFLRSIMSGTFVRHISEQDAISILYGIAEGIHDPGPLLSPGCRRMPPL